jgi:hypothetical protein
LAENIFLVYSPLKTNEFVDLFTTGRRGSEVLRQLRRTGIPMQNTKCFMKMKKWGYDEDIKREKNMW